MSASPAELNAASVYSVTRLNRELRLLMEHGLPPLWLEGEISNFVRPASGHWYFTLKDSDAQIRCAMFRGRNQLVRSQPGNGLRVRLRGRVTLYEARGESQFIAEQMEPAGEGALRQALERLKARLAAEGLFTDRHKQPLPTLPQRIGLITSPSGAAIRDMLTVLRRRFPCVQIVVYPSAVQGAAAVPELVAALEHATRRREVEVLIIGRGGGSLEDLWAFNEEPLVRAIHACPLPIVSAVGHEIDFTLADLVADQRAATPSAAAELVVPEARALLARVLESQQRLLDALQRQQQQQTQRLQGLQQRLRAQHPEQQLARRAQRLDELSARLGRASRSNLESQQRRQEQLQARLRAASPAQRLHRQRQRLQLLLPRLYRAISRPLDARRQRIAVAAGSLQVVSPLATLERGYAIARRPDGAVLRRAEHCEVGERLQLKLAQGSLHCDITDISAI